MAESRQRAASAPGTPQLLSDSSTSRSSALISLSLLVTALLGAVQGVLLVYIVGEGPRTDAFLAAYSLYTALILFGASLRGSIVPLFGAQEPESEFRERASVILGRTLVIGLVLLVAMLIVAPIAGFLQTSGLGQSAQWVAVWTLLILAPAAYLQLHAAAVAGFLSSVRRFDLSAALYVVASLIAVTLSSALLFVVGVLGMALGLLVAATLLAVGHVAYARTFGIRTPIRIGWLREREQYRFAGLLTAGAAPGIAVQVNLAVSLGLIPHRTGAITAYSYAFFLVSLILTVSALPIGLVTLPDLVARIERSGAGVAEAHFERVVPYTFAVLAPLTASLIAFGRPVLQFALEPALSHATIALVYDLAVVQCGMALAMALMYLAGPVALAKHRYPRLIWTGLVLIAGNAALVVSLSSHGARAVAAAQAVAAALGTCFLLWQTFDGRWLGVVGRALWRSAPAFVLSLAIFAIRAPLGSAPSLAIDLAAAVVGLAAYAVLAVLFWPSGSAPFVELVRRRRAVES